MRIVKTISFELYVDRFCKGGKTFVVESKRRTHSLFMDNKLLLLNKNEKKRFKYDKKKRQMVVNLFAQVQKNINKYLRQVEFEIIPIKKRFGSVKNNKTKWRDLVNGETFYYIDVNHCYWRIAFLKSYISKKLYETTLMKPSIKVQRNMSLALIIAPKKRAYYKHGKFICEIQEEKTMYRTVYDNIRFTAYNLMGDCMILSRKSFISYRTDGIMVKIRAVKKVVEFIEKNGFNCSVIECCKMDMKHYLYDVDGKKLEKRF